MSLGTDGQQSAEPTQPSVNKPTSDTLLRLGAIAAGFVLPALAARAARAGAGSAYRLATRREPPKNPASRDTDWAEALAWAAFAGVAGALARLVTRRSLPVLGLPAEGLDLEDEVDKVD